MVIQKEPKINFCPRCHSPKSVGGSCSYCGYPNKFSESEQIFAAIVIAVVAYIFWLVFG